MNTDLWHHLQFLFGDDTAQIALGRLVHTLEKFKQTTPPSKNDRTLSEQDTIIITYGDMVQKNGEVPLQTLGQFLRHSIHGVISTVHILPFYPYSSDDGFSVIDYWAVNPELGSWAEISALGDDFRLMFDAVINHISAHSDWFQRFLQGDPDYKDYFIAVDPNADLTAVFRPRALPLLTEVETVNGPRHVWTTFSPDQIDLNFANPDVLLAIIDLLLFYVHQGAELIRLDAIAFMWKSIGTNCLHLPQTHRAIQLMRSVLDEVAPHVKLITETNVPHKDNISYFGDGRNEAQMVYNFSLPPLTLHAFHTGQAEILSQWAASLTLPSQQVTFFNFLASHDGIGVTPARGILPDEAIEAMATRVQALGGYVSFKNNSDGTQSAYELNINYLDALGDPANPAESLVQKSERFLTAQAIMLALRGVPGIYFHSLFGSQSWLAGVEESGRYRTINRQKLAIDTLTAALSNPESLRHLVFTGYRHMLQVRASQKAFHPNGEQTILALHPALFAVLRKNGRSRVLCLQNVSNQPVTIALDPQEPPLARVTTFTDLLSNTTVAANAITIPTHGRLWLQPE